MACHKIDDNTIFCEQFQTLFPADTVCITCPLFTSQQPPATDGVVGIGDCLKAAFAKRGWTTAEACSCEQLRSELNTATPADVQTTIDEWVERILPNVVHIQGIAGAVARAGAVVCPSIAKHVIRNILQTCIDGTAGSELDISP